MTVTIEQIKELREKTGVSMQACKKALEENNGSIEDAITALRKKGEAKAAERSERSTSEGVIGSYIHANKKIGVMVQLGSETDFVAKNEDFQALAKDIAMHIAALNPKYISPDEVTEEELEKEREIWKEQLKNEGKPENVWDKIIEGKENKFKNELSLNKQAFVKNPEVTIEQLVKDTVAKVGENIKLVRFVRYEI